MPPEMLCTACGVWSAPATWDQATGDPFARSKVCPGCGAEHDSRDVPYRIREQSARDDPPSVD